MKDEVFNQELPEWYEGGELSSAHDEESIKYFDLPYSYVLFCYPRAGTPVCTKELKNLQKNLSKFKLPVIVASTDSPEVHSDFLNDEEAFPPKEVPNIEYPVLTLRSHLLTDFGNQVIFNEYGYCKRTAIVVKEGKVSAIYSVANEDSRNIKTLLALT